MYGPEVRVVAGKMEEAIRQAVGLWNRRPREDRLACLLGEAMACTISADLAARIDAALKEET